jgi:hypothetical protein
VKGRKIDKTIWSLNDLEGRNISSFEGVSRLGKDYFQTLFKEDQRVSVVDIVRMTLFFPGFVGEEENWALMEEVLEEELRGVLYIFQKYKSPGPNGC